MDNAIAVLPEFVLVISALALLVLGQLAPRWAASSALFGLLAGLGILVGQAATGIVGGPALAGALQIGPFAWVMRLAVLLFACAAAGLAWEDAPARPERFFPALTASAAGAMSLASAATLPAFIACLSLAGLPLLALRASRKKDPANDLAPGQAALGTWLFGGVFLAAIAGLARLLLLALPMHAALWTLPVTVLGGLCLVGGSLLALAHAEPRRVLSRTVFAAAGLPLLALLAASQPAVSHDALAALVMTALTTAVAASGLHVGLVAAKAKGLGDLAGLHRRSAPLALALVLCAVGLAALPLSGAFWARLALVRAQLLYVSASQVFAAVALAILVMAIGVLGAYVALRLPKAILLERPDPNPPAVLAVPMGQAVWLALTAGLSAATFAAPAVLWMLASFAARGF